MTAETITTARPNLFRELVESKQNSDWNNKNLGQIYFMKIQHLKGKKKTLIETFYKIGYTGYKDLASRICYMPSCYSVEVIDTAIFDRAEARHLEGLIHKHNRRFSYKPRHRFDGSTECYNLSLMDAYPTLSDMIANVKQISAVDLMNKPVSLHTMS